MTGIHPRMETLEMRAETGMDSERILWLSTKTCSQTHAGRREGEKERGEK